MVAKSEDSSTDRMVSWVIPVLSSRVIDATEGQLCWSIFWKEADLSVTESMLQGGCADIVGNEG